MALPKFSRNYTRSGAYENPVTPVDTNTGAIIAQTISNVGNITANFIERQNQTVNAENAAIKKMLNGINKKATTEKEQYSKSLGEHGLAQNENFAKVGTEMIDYLEEQETLLAMYKRNDDLENAKIAENNIFKTNLAYGKLTQVIKETPDAFKTYSEDVLSPNNGRPGGIALSGAGKNNNQYWFGMSAYRGSSADSSSNLIWDKDSDEKGLSMILNSKEIQQNKNLFTEDEDFQGINVEPLSFLQSDPGRIPDIKTSGVKILGAKTDDNPNGVNLVGKNGQVNDLSFYDTSSVKKITRKGGKVYVQYNYNEEAVVDRYKKSVEDNLVKPFTTNSDISRINAVSNNIYNYEMIPDADAANENDSPFSVNDQTKFQESTLSYVRGLVPPPKEFVFDEAEYDGIEELTAAERKAAEKLEVTTEQLDGIKNFPMEINVEKVTVIGDKGVDDKFELINKLAQNMVKDIPGKSLKLRKIDGGDVEFLLGNVSMGTASIEDLTSEEVKKFVYKMYGGSPKEIGGLSGEVLPQVQGQFSEFARK